MDPLRVSYLIFVQFQQGLDAGMVADGKSQGIRAAPGLGDP